ncbi:hypothetical protein CDL15_Pgr017914 [Punica granatum]|uniref:Uncharacterized protein n=1 Tax=Punica granatum TaxID=22663 RepID=A0A218WIH5_PUNGR|nr:hypothetical protein CDL15_Pgr017914 [Punica granatum]PKI53975.1 hypothetical protein CRG98_025586 [Punica granatum]
MWSSRLVWCLSPLTRARKRMSARVQLLKADREIGLGCNHRAFLGLSLCFLLLLVLAFGDCTCEEDNPDQENSNGALGYKLGTIACFLVGGALGVCLPFLAKAAYSQLGERPIHYREGFCFQGHPSHGIHSCLPRRMREFDVPRPDCRSVGELSLCWFHCNGDSNRNASSRYNCDLVLLFK